VAYYSRQSRKAKRYNPETNTIWWGTANPAPPLRLVRSTSPIELQTLVTFARLSTPLHPIMDNLYADSPTSCGGGELKGADDEEEALLTARLAAYRRSPEGRDRARMLKLMFKSFGRRLSVDEQNELDCLKQIIRKVQPVAPWRKPSN
jgi:hypothetical protein